ncbi:MAG: hypothetical protein FOGNACKC_03040 [Anaerolineae bacterium]|nr:hypothetical protein [Anaerolineae bacterium]
MNSIESIISDLRFSRSTLLRAIAGLSQRELTQTPINGAWTIKEVLAHIVGWDNRTLNTLKLITTNRAGEVPGVDVQPFNQQSVAAASDKTLAEVMAEAHEIHEQVIELISRLDYKEIDRRHERNGRFITIRSYVIDIMADHERQHAAEIELWRQQLEQSINPDALVAALRQERARFLNLLEQFTLDGQLSDPDAVGRWSVSDVVGHLADWELRMLKAAKHIHDPSLPPVAPAGDSDADWNDILAARRKDKSWAENYQDLLAVQAEVDAFVNDLTPGDWRLRGPYPWPDDQGSLAELVVEITEHYADHIPALEQWAANVRRP